jgi:hypothetical protein
MTVCYRSGLGIAIFSVGLHAQTGSVPPINVFAPSVLSLPASTRALGMGNVGVASRDDDVLFYNPAQLAIARGMSASGERYSPSARGGALSSVTRFNNGGIAVGMTMVNYDPPGPTLPSTPGELSHRGVGSASSLDAVIGLAQVYKSVRVGVAAKYVEDQLPDVRIGRAAFDVGLAKDFSRFYSVGLAVQNIGGSTTYPCPTCTLALSDRPPNPPLTIRARSPLRTTLGVATARQLGPFDAAATLGVSLLRGEWMPPAGGAELGYSWLDGYSIAVRLGASAPSPSESRATGGIGFTMDRLTLDYAAESVWSGKSVVQHRIGLRVR